MCDCCKDESGGKDIGVASIPGVPMSIMWCDRCIHLILDGDHKIVVPTYAIEYFFIFGGQGNLDNLIDEVKEYYTWADNRYMSMTEYVKRITPEQVEMDLARYNETQ